MPQAIRLIFNADDFGFTRDVNEGIVEAHRNGVLTATTLMANGDAFDHALACAKETPSLDVGMHLVLAQGSSVATPGKVLPETLQELARALMRRELDVYGEASAQVRKIVAAGIHPSHIDTHKHTHLFPPVLDAVAKIAKEFDIPGGEAAVRLRNRAGFRTDQTGCGRGDEADEPEFFEKARLAADDGLFHRLPGNRHSGYFRDDQYSEHAAVRFD